MINSDKQFCLINSDKQFCMINSDKKDPKLYDLLQDMREKETHGRFHYLCYPWPFVVKTIFTYIDSDW